MSRLQVSRRVFFIAAVMLTVGGLSFAAVTQAVAARRGWGARLRPTLRTPATTTPAAGQPTITPGVPTPATRATEPEGPVARHGAELPEALSHKLDQGTVLQDILEIRRRIHVDPAFRELTGSGVADAAQSAFWDHEGGSEAAFRKALETVDGNDAEISICRTTNRDGDTNCRMSVRPHLSEGSEIAEPSGSSGSALRSAARVLDARANDCEDAGAYARADELRDTARQLRQEARRGN